MECLYDMVHGAFFFGVAIQHERYRGSRASCREPRGTGSDESGRHVNIAVDGLGVWADRVRGIDQGLCLVALDARYADVETRPEEKRAVRQVQIDFRVDRQAGRKLNLPLR